MNRFGKNRLLEMMERVSGMPVNEIDWEGDFKDVSKTCLNPNELKDYLNKILDNYALPSNKRKKSDLLIHNKAIPFDDKGAVDVDAFIADISKIPQEIISSNGKMEKSSSSESITYNIGVPALRGIVYDQERKEFYIVNTCPGAGSCAVVCYARRGNYVILPDVFRKQTRVLNLLLNDPELFQKLLYNELERVCLSNKGTMVFFRWDDAGDFFTKKYFDIALKITKRLKASGYTFNSYAYTKMGDIYNVNDPDFLLTFSTDGNAKERDKVDLNNAKTAEIVPKEIFSDLFQKKGIHFDVDANKKLIPIDSNSFDILKQRISARYGIDVNSLITYDEMLKIPEGNGDNMLNVITMAKGDGDISAQRRDVKKSYLLIH